MGKQCTGYRHNYTLYLVQQAVATLLLSIIRAPRQPELPVLRAAGIAIRPSPIVGIATNNYRRGRRIRSHADPQRKRRGSLPRRRHDAISPLMDVQIYRGSMELLSTWLTPGSHLLDNKLAR